MRLRIMPRNRRGEDSNMWFGQIATPLLIIAVVLIVFFVVRYNLLQQKEDVDKMTCRSSYDFDEDGWVDSLDTCICNEKTNPNCEQDCEDPQKRQEFSEERDRILCGDTSTTLEAET